MPRPQPVPTPEEIQQTCQSRLKTYLENRAAGMPPMKAATSTITASYPPWRANRTARIVSVFHMFAQKYATDPHPFGFKMMTEQDLVMLMLMCCTMADYPAPPGSPVRTIASKITIALLRSNFRALQAPLTPGDLTITGRLKSFLLALLYTWAGISERLLALVTSLIPGRSPDPDRNHRR